MAPQVLPTATATALAAVSSTTYSTVAPLTTIWTPPASCASQIPTVIIGGTCNQRGCTTFNAAQVASASWEAWLSFGYYTIGGVQVSTGCAPPSTQVGDYFSYSPAIGCPSGSYNSIQTFYNGGYGCWRYVTSAETMSMVAWGTIPQTDSGGYTTSMYGTLSPISTTIVQPTRLDGSRVWVYAPPVRMVIASIGASTTPTTTVFPGSSDYTPTSDAIPFHIGPLNFTYSIVVLAAAGLFCLILGCCCYCCCRRRPRPVPTWPHDIRGQDASPYMPQPYVTQAPPPASATALCPHQISNNCRSTVNNPCCACADKRTLKMSREARVQSYCIFCNCFWNAIPISMCPSEWELLGPPCAHKQSGPCEGDQESNSCCACFDARSQYLNLDLRVSNYCPPCRRLWEMKQPKDWPASWARPPVQPTHAPKPTPTPKPRPIPRPAPQQKPPKPDAKSLAKDIELNILSRVSKEPEIEASEITESAENDGLQYGEPTLQVIADHSRSQSALSPSSTSAAKSMASAPTDKHGSSRSSTPMAGGGERKKKSELQYEVPKFSVPAEK